MKLKTMLLSVVAAGYAVAASAQTFTYNPGDLFAAFRTSGGATNVIVDIGSASVYQNATGTTTISAVNAALLTSTFGSLDGIYWSVFGGLASASGLGASHTIWVTDGRPDPSTQTDPWQSSNFSGQGGVVSQIGGIQNGTGAAGSTSLSSTIVLVPSSLNNGGAQISYTVGIGPNGDFNGAWRGDIENLTPGGFGSSSTPAVSDLYQQNPGLANSGNFLGDFVLGNDGSLTFDSVTPAPEPSTLALAGFGIAGLLAMRRMRARK